MNSRAADLSTLLDPFPADRAAKTPSAPSDVTGQLPRWWQNAAAILSSKLQAIGRSTDN